MRFQSLWQMPLLLGVAATSLTYAAAPAAVAVASAAPVVAAAPAASSPVDTATLLKQIEDLKKQVSHIAHKQRKADEKLESTVKVEDAKIGVLQANQVSPYPVGFIAIPGTNSAIKIGGRIKADGSYNANVSGDASGAEVTVKTLPIQGSGNTAHGKSGHVNGTLQASRFEINSLTRTNQGDINAQLQTDFYGADSSAVKGSSTSGTAYGLRVRQANVVWNQVLVGQTDTNFCDADLVPSTLDNNGPISNPRRLQLRWTQKVADGLNLSISAEKGNTDYATNAGDFYDNAKNGKTSVPDFAARLRYEGKQGFVSLRGIVRTLQVNVAASDAVTSTSGQVAAQRFSSKQTGWGLGVSGKLITVGKSNLYSLATIGDGLGYLIDDASNQGAYLQVPTAASGTTAPTPAVATRYAARFDTNTVTHGLLGYEHWFTEQFRTNLVGSYTKIKNSPFSPVLNGTTQLNARVMKVFVNAIYSPVKQVDIGVEFMYGIRETIKGMIDSSAGTQTAGIYGGGTGKATQVMTSFIYKF